MPAPGKCKDKSKGRETSIPEYDRVILRKTSSVAGLKDVPETTLWRRHESGPQSIHVWAPEIRYLDGGWYIYYVAGDKDSVWDIRPYILKEKWFTLQVVIRSFNSFYAVNSDYPLIMAASVLAILPTLLLFFFFQRYIIESIAVSGVKG